MRITLSVERPNINNFINNVISKYHFDESAKVQMTDIYSQIRECAKPYAVYRINQKATGIRIIDDSQAAVVAMLVKRFGYDPKSAVEYFFFLVDATKKENHPAVNNIICRGLDRFESIDDNEVVKNEVDRIVSILSEK